MRNRSGFAFIDLVIVTAAISGLAAVALPSLLAGGRYSNERAAVISLKTITTAEADFRSNDRDGNRVSDFWTADLFALYGMVPITGSSTSVPEDRADAVNCIRLIEPSLAASDGRTDQALYGNGEFAETAGPGRAKRGHVVRALHNAEGGAGATTLLNDTDGAGLFYGPCHDTDRFAYIAFPVSLMAGRAVYVVNEDNRIWKYPLPSTYKATFTGISGASTDSTSTTAAEKGLADEFALAAASGHGTFPAHPPRIGCSEVEGMPKPDWEDVTKQASLPLTVLIDKGLAETKEGIVLLAEIEPDGKKVVCAMDIAAGREVLAAHVDSQDGKVLAKESAADDRSAFVKSFKVTAKQGIEAAMKKLPGTAVSVELVEHKGQPVIHVRVWSEGKLKVAAINGEDGSVTAVSELR